MRLMYHCGHGKPLSEECMVCAKLDDIDRRIREELQRVRDLESSLRKQTCLAFNRESARDAAEARAKALETAIRQAIEECDKFETRITIRTGLALALGDDEISGDLGTTAGTENA